MTYEFIVDTYETEIIKVLSVWSMFKDDELPTRPEGFTPISRTVELRVNPSVCAFPLVAVF